MLILAMLAAPWMYAPTPVPNPMGFDTTRVIGFNEHSEVLVDAVAEPHAGGRTCDMESYCFAAFWSEKDGYRPILTIDESRYAWYALNDRGEVAGRRQDMPNERGSIFLWSAKQGVKDIAPVARFTAWSPVAAVNNRGVIAGTDILFTSGVTAFVASEKEGLRYLPSESQATAVNDAGEVVGRHVRNTLQAFYWSEKTGLIDLGAVLGATSSTAIDIDKHGLVLGRYDSTAGDFFFLWDPKRGVRHVVPLDSACEAVSLNESGQVLGNCNTSGLSKAWIWTANEGMRDIGNLGYDAVAVGQNDRGQVVGRSRATATGPYHAFVWSPSTGMVDLDPTAPSRESIARFINKGGAIAGETGGQAVVWKLTK